MNEDRATRYHRLKRGATIGAAVIRAVFLGLVVVAGRDPLQRIVSLAVPSSWPVLQAASAAFVLLIVSEEIGRAHV